jgi:hypothetical protein
MKRRGYHYVGSDFYARSFKLGPLRVVQLEDRDTGENSSFAVGLRLGRHSVKYERSGR